MKVFVILVIFAAFEASNAATVSCYRCASTNLLNAWYLTGYKIEGKPATAEFVSACGAAQSTSSTKDTTCTGGCIAYYFQLTNAKGALDDYWVRGCYDKLTGFTDTIATATCETSSTEAFYDAAGAVALTGKAQAQICNTGDCNGSEFGTSTCTTTVTRSIKCVQCGEVSSNCGSPKDLGGSRWCGKSTVAINGVKKYTKFNSNVNPLGKETCLSNTYTDAYFPLRSANNKVESKQCFCTTANCNGAAGMTVGLLSIAASIVMMLGK